MRKLSTFALLYLLWLSRVAMAQTIAIQNQQYISTCVGATVSLSISTSGTFAADNAFRVDLTATNGAAGINLPATVVNNVLTFTVPTSATMTNNYWYRVFSTNPVIYSAQSDQALTVSQLPTAQLTRKLANTIPVNSYERVYIPVKLTGGSPYTLVMQDGTSYGDDGTNSISVSPMQTTSYSIVSVQNSCGAGTSEGSTMVLINERNIKAALGKTVVLCDESVMPVYFVTDGPLPAGITFEAQLYETSNNKPIASLPISGTASPLSLTIPASLMQDDLLPPYRVLIQAKNRALSFWYPGEGSFMYRSLNKTPLLSLRGPVPVIFGQLNGFYVDYTDGGGGTVVLNNGRKVQLTSGESGQAWVPVQIDRPTSYSIASYESFCNRTPVYKDRSIQLTVLPGMRIDSLSAGAVCEGEPVTLYYSTTLGFTVPDRIRLRTVATQWTEAVQTQPGQLTFVAPTRLPDVFYSGGIELRDPVSNSLLTGSSVQLIVKGKSRATITQPYYPEIREPGLISISFSKTTDGDTCLVTLNTGQTFSLNAGSFPLYVSETTTFSVVATRNECGVDSTRSSAQWIVRNPSSSPRITLQPGTITRPYSKVDPQKIVCPGMAFWINPTVSGTFAADNRFQLEIADANGSFTAPPSLTTSAPVAMSIAWPGAAQSLTVRLSSTNPVMQSEPLTLRNYYDEPTIKLQSQETESGISAPDSGTIASGQLMKLTYVFKGLTPMSYKLTSPQSVLSSGFVYYPSVANQSTLETTWQTSASGLYGLRGVRDACGRLAIGQSAKQITVVSSSIVTGISSIICANLPAQVPFSQTGTVPQNTTFVVQASLDQVTWQTLNTSGTKSPLSVQFPPAFADQRAYYRVVALLPDGNNIIGTASASTVFTPPVLRIGGANAYSVVSTDAYGFGTFPVETINPASPLRTVLIQKTGTSQVENVGTSNQYFFSSPGTYSIVSASNQCGYGSGSGVVRVVRRPTLSKFATNKTAYCTGENIAVTYTAADLALDNSLSLYLTDGRATKTLLTQTTVASGTYSFSLSPTMTPGSYSLVYESALPVEPLNQVATFTVQNPLSLTLGPARAVVYADAVPALPLTVNANAGPYSLTLSTPSGVSALAGTYTSVLTLPRVETGTYTLLTAANQCGAGRVTGSVSVTVLSAVAVRIEADPKATLSLLCVDRAYTLPISTSGTFGANNAFTAYLTDSTGTTQLTLPTTSKGDVLTITVPANAPVGDGYLLRVGSSEPAHLGASLRNTIQIRPTPTATLTGNNTIIKGDSTRLSVSMTGAGPWQLTIADSQGPRSYIAAQSPYSLSVRPDTTTTYRLTEVRNGQCGVGAASGTALIAVSRLLATEPLAVQVRVWPNPTAGTVQVTGELPADGMVQLSLRTLLGTLVQGVGVSPRQGRLQHALDLSQLPSGLYILTAEQQGRRSQFKIVKQ